MKRIRRTVIFKNDDIQLEIINVEIGNCKMKKWRQVSLIDGELEVIEMKECPDWYLRQLKLKELGL